MIKGLRRGLGAVYEEHKTLSDTKPRRFTDKALCLNAALVYTKTQDAYLGNQAGQDFMLDATDYFGAKGARIYDVDVSTLWFRAVVAGAVIHIIGTTREYPCVK